MSEATLQLLTSRSVRKDLSNPRPDEITGELVPTRLIAHIVVGVEAAEGIYETMSGYHLTGQEKRHVLTLPSLVAARFRTFYNRTQSHPDGTQYECYSFTSFVQGAEQEILPFDSFTHESKRTHRPVPINELAEGLPYIAIDGSGSGVHAMLGASASYLNVGALGPGEELALTANVQMLSYYGAVAIHGLSYPGASLTETT